jgi:hypothetical protein
MTLNLFVKVIVVMNISPVLSDEVVLLDIVRPICFSGHLDDLVGKKSG